MNCHRCGAAVITAYDDIGFDVTLDPTPLTARGECLAIVMTARATFDVIPANKRHGREVWRRNRWMIGNRAHGSLHAEHRCGQPIPADWAAPVATITRQQLDPDNPPF